MKLQDYKKEYCELQQKKNLTGAEALEAVKQDGYALRFVKEDMFSADEIFTMENGKQVSRETVEFALKEYFK